MRRSSKVAVSLALASAVYLACAAPGFDPQSKLTSVRVLAVQADKPFANPGDTVKLQALAVDARPDTTNPMRVYWLPLNCVNPKLDLYYACFSTFAGFPGGRDGGAEGGGGGGGGLTQPIDITAFLVSGPSFSVKLPSDIITSHPPVDGAPDPYGLTMTFFIACTGHVFAIPPDPSTGPSGQYVPVACGESPDNLYGPNDNVFGFTRVYAYADLVGPDGMPQPLTNANPVINGVTFDGQPVDLTQGIQVPRCTSGTCNHPVDVQVPDDSWEINPTDKDSNGNLRHEQLYAEYFYDVGGLKSNGRILFDPIAGRITDSANQFEPGNPGPNDPVSGTVYIVVHDNRDGVAWVSFPVAIAN